MLRLMLIMFAGILLVVLVWRLFSKPAATSSHPAELKVVKCHHCGVHILESEAIQQRGQYFCCREHAQHHE